MRNLLIVLVLLTGCGEYYTDWVEEYKEKPKVIATEFDPEVAIRSKALRYRELAKAEQDANGFLYTHRCDSLLFSGLYSAAVPEKDVNILAAYESGQWFRRPSKDCGPEFGNSRSTISRDMILGVMWHIWRNRDLAMAEHLREDIKSNNYILRGDGTPGELFVIPSFVHTLDLIIGSLGGKSEVGDLLLPNLWDDSNGYVSHLTVWHILLRGEARGYIVRSELDELERIYLTNRNNPLYSAAYHKYMTGDMAEATKLLLNNNLWPANELPDNRNYCSLWLVETAFESHDLQPCLNGDARKRGFELVVIYELIIK